MKYSCLAAPVGIKANAETESQGTLCELFCACRSRLKRRRSPCLPACLLLLLLLIPPLRVAQRAKPVSADCFLLFLSSLAPPPSASVSPPNEQVTFQKSVEQGTRCGPHHHSRGSLARHTCQRWRRRSAAESRGRGGVSPLAKSI